MYYWYTIALPRFRRLPQARRAEILAVARSHFARDGLERASYNQIMADAGFSKTSAYLYFDGKGNLIETVRVDLAMRLNALLEPFEPQRSKAAFWRALHAASERLRQHLADDAIDLALLRHFAESLGPDSSHAWFEAVLTNATALGLVRKDVDRRLMLAATKALFHVIDREAIRALSSGEAVSPEGWVLLRGLWGVRR